MRDSTHNHPGDDPIPDSMATLLNSRRSPQTGRPPSGPPDLDLDLHPNGRLAHIALRDLVFEDPALTIAHLRDDPSAVLGTASRRVAERWPLTRDRYGPPPTESVVTPFEGGRLRGVIVALPQSPCPAAADYVLAAGPRAPGRGEQAPLYVVSERVIEASGALSARLGRWFESGLYERIGPGVPWGVLTFEEAVLDAMRGRSLAAK